MMRRPPGLVAQQRSLLFALALFLLPRGLGLVDAQQQQQQQPQPPDHLHHHDDARPLVSGHDQALAAAAAAIFDAGSADAGSAFFDNAALSPLHKNNINNINNINGDEAKTKSPAEGDAFVPRLSVETPRVQKKHTADGRPLHYDNILIPDDASALATLAPDLSVRAPPPPHRATTASPAGHGLASPQSARSLEDWEVEDFVLLATVNGDLYATDRKTGTVLWHTVTEKPVVEIAHHRAHVSPLDEGFRSVDHYIWAVEPDRDGSIYIMTPRGAQSRLVDTSLTMKRLVEMTPFIDEHIVYMGRKETTMVTLDAATGRVYGWYGSLDPEQDFKNRQPESCVNPPSDFDASPECPVSGTIILGRTDYTVHVSRTDIGDQQLIATLKYSEWGPNNYDRDLHQQYHTTVDNQYITSKPDGQVYAVNAASTADGDKALSLRYRLSAPICRVFDIARPLDVPQGTSPELLVLPQPPPPAEDEDMARLRRVSVFMNETEGGSWYAMSGSAYPLIVNAPHAQCTRDGWWESHQDVDPTQLRKALVGRHFLLGAGRRTLRHSFPTLPGGDASNVFDDEPGDVENGSTVPPFPPVATESPTVIGTVRQLPQVAANSLVDFLRNPIFIIAVFTFLFVYHKDLRRWYNGTSARKRKASLGPIEVQPTEPTPVAVLEEQSADDDRAESEDANVTPAPESVLAEDDRAIKPEVDGEDAGKENLQAARPAEPAPPDSNNSSNNSNNSNDDVPSEEAPKKKAHRGRRGGTRHRKGKNKREPSVSQGDDSAPGTVDDAVGKAIEIGNVSKQVEPDVHTVSTDMQEITGPILRMGSIEVDEDRQLGTGSNGTVVFAGKFDGRDVAVKRMLIQFYDIASQETRLLRESDDHRNVIRYYAQQQRDAFLYIALELCQASLAEIVEKPNLHRDLAVAGAADLPGVLYQITNGLSHLHALRIVHRDLKPQNILVNMERDGKPRLLVSDFGLCKKLEGGQSSFGATTAHAAGTSGWRAPELLLDDDARDSGTAMVDATSAHSGSGSLVSSDLMPNRRATRAIDIFSLGLVFFYVLTQGRHPFDCGDRYMREVNIRKGNYNLDALDIVDSAFEAKDLVRGMLNANPKARPNTEGVMAHPFFWPPKKRLNFLCDVSDHFEKEPRDPPSGPLQKLESFAPEVCRGDFLKRLPKDFIESLGKQRKYTGTRLLDLLRALRNKRNHYEDMSEALQAKVGPLPDGYVRFWMGAFPNLLISCWDIGWSENWMETDRFQEYYLPTRLGS